jgi:indolepyruvate ferredoxin oxidoreductase
VKRQPYFCAGCPHNTSTRVPDGSHARAGIGCHFMANWMDRSTEGLIQMGGEGVDWVSHAMFTKVPHVFQNLGDGTYFHSGYLAIRQAVAAKATLTYKILFNDAVAMTGGQPVDGPISVDAIARQVESEGVAGVVVLSDDIRKYDAIKGRFPAGTEFHDRDALDAVQRRLRDMPGVTVLIYEQTCAAEKRRRRKKQELADPPKRLFINDAVCEGCGDCGVQSNCVAVLPHETPLGRKRHIDQSAATRTTAAPRASARASWASPAAGRGATRACWTARRDTFLQRVQALPLPAAHKWTGPYDLLVTGVGGTGVVTVGALVTMAAHLQGHSASVLDFMGFAQKGGAVLSFVRLARDAADLHQVRIDAQQADAVLACDLVVAASPDALLTVRHGRTRILANEHPIPVADSVRKPDAELHTAELLAKLHFAAGADRVQTFDAQALAQDFLGDTVAANVVALGCAWQQGLVPVSLAALQRAIELNGVAVPLNQLAFSLGRLAAGDPQALAALREPGPAVAPAVDADLPALIDRAAAPPHGLAGRAWADALPAHGACSRSDRAGAGCRQHAALHAGGGTQPAEADELQGRVRGRAPVHRRPLPARAARAVRRRPAAGIPHGAAAAVTRTPGPAAAQAAPGAVAAAAAEGAGVRPALARHGAGPVRPHRGTAAGAAADHRLRAARRRAAGDAGCAAPAAGHRHRARAAVGARLRPRQAGQPGAGAVARGRTAAPLGPGASPAAQAEPAAGQFKGIAVVTG